MKKIFMVIALCFMCAANVFSENYYWKKVNLIETEYLSDGQYLICFDTPDEKVKIFKNFNDTVLIINKLTDSTFICDNSLQWVIERIGNRLYNIQNNDGYYIATQFDKTEYGTLEYTKTNDLVYITSSGQIYSYFCGSDGCLKSWQHISFDETTNTFNVVTDGDENISLYSLYACNCIYNMELNENGYKEYSDGMIFIVKNGVKYNILGQIVRN